MIAVHQHAMAGNDYRRQILERIAVALDHLVDWFQTRVQLFDEAYVRNAGVTPASGQSVPNGVP
jgi:hypothetical protein